MVDIQAGLPHSASTPQGLPTSVNGVGKICLRGHSTPVWAMLDSQNVHSLGGCPEWVVQSEQVMSLLHYLDDYLLVH